MDEGGIVTTTRTVTPRTDLPEALPGLLSALPSLALAVAGAFHPDHLTHDSSHTWWGLHVAGLFAFPLVGLALAALFRGRRDPLAAVAVLAAFVYATAYTALDVINGIGAGYVTWRLDPAAPRPDEVRSLFDIGSPLGQVGSWALVLAAVLVCADALTRDRVLALPGLLLVPGAFLVHTDHIFWPLGVLGITLVGLGTGWLRGAVYTRKWRKEIYVRFGVFGVCCRSSPDLLPERDAMLSVAPASVMLIGVLGMFIIAFAVARMTVLERKIQRPAYQQPSREFAGSGV